MGTEQVRTPAIAELVAKEFSQITPENEMKWTVLQPQRDVYDFARSDELVDFAMARGLSVRGHTLVWLQDGGNGSPAWQKESATADEAGLMIEQHVSTVVSRYRGRVPRWDVVNEPLANPGSTLANGRVTELLGQYYIDIAFRAARAADPNAELWLNEIDAEKVVERGDALVALVRDLKARGVPVDGVGLESHFIDGPPPPGRIKSLIERLRALDVEVAITELDIPVDDSTDPTAYDRQAASYAQVVGECLAAGCAEITLWGVSDGNTWLDAFLDRDSRPLIFDEALAPKPAYDAVLDSLAGD